MPHYNKRETKLKGQKKEKLAALPRHRYTKIMMIFIFLSLIALPQAHIHCASMDAALEETLFNGSRKRIVELFKQGKWKPQSAEKVDKAINAPQKEAVIKALGQPLSRETGRAVAFWVTTRNFGRSHAHQSFKNAKEAIDSLRAHVNAPKELIDGTVYGALRDLTLDQLSSAPFPRNEPSLVGRDTLRYMASHPPEDYRLQESHQPSESHQPPKEDHKPNSNGAKKTALGASGFTLATAAAFAYALLKQAALTRLLKRSPSNRSLATATRRKLKKLRTVQWALLVPLILSGALTTGAGVYYLKNR